MTRNPFAFALAAALTAASLACQSGSSTPSAPTGGSGPDDWWTTGPGGASLKASPPVAQSPKDNVTVDSLTPTLVVSGGGTIYKSGVVQYRFRVMDNTGSLSTDSGLLNTPSWTLPAPLTPTTQYTWIARPEYRGLSGPWSTGAVFTTPVAPGNDYGAWEATCSGLPPGTTLVSCVWNFVHPQNSFDDLEVAKRVAWILRGIGGGLFLKSSGDSTAPWLGFTFSVSRICFPDGHLFKILTDAGPGGTNGPQYADNDFVDPSFYFKAVDPRIR